MYFILSYFKRYITPKIIYFYILNAQSGKSLLYYQRDFFISLLITYSKANNELNKLLMNNIFGMHIYRLRIT